MQINSRESKKIIQKIWERDMSVTDWSRANGFNPRTVYAFLELKVGHIRGGRITHKIMQRFLEQGLLNGIKP